MILLLIYILMLIVVLAKSKLYYVILFLKRIFMLINTNTSVHTNANMNMCQIKGILPAVVVCLGKPDLGQAGGSTII